VLWALVAPPPSRGSLTPQYVAVGVHGNPNVIRPRNAGEIPGAGDVDFAVSGNRMFVRGSSRLECHRRSPTGGSTGPGERSEERAHDPAEAVASRPVMRKRSAASRLRSLCSPLARL